MVEIVAEAADERLWAGNVYSGTVGCRLQRFLQQLIGAGAAPGGAASQGVVAAKERTPLWPEQAVPVTASLMNQRNVARFLVVLHLAHHANKWSDAYAHRNPYQWNGRIERQDKIAKWFADMDTIADLELL